MELFQWLSGPNVGETAVLEYIDIENGEMYLNFTNGTRCNREFVALLNETNINGKVIAHISGEDNKWNIKIEKIPAIEEEYVMEKGERFCVQPYVPARIKSKHIPPKVYHVDEIKTFDMPFNQMSIKSEPVVKTPPQQEQIKAVEQPKPVEQSKPDEQPKPVQGQESVVDTLLSPSEVLCMSCKKSDISIGLELDLELPSVDLYGVIVSNFADGKEGFRRYLDKHIETEMIKKHVIDIICETYASNLANETKIKSGHGE